MMGDDKMAIIKCDRCGNPLNTQDPEVDIYVEVKIKQFGGWARKDIKETWRLCEECGNKFFNFLKSETS